MLLLWKEQAGSAGNLNLHRKCAVTKLTGVMDSIRPKLPLKKKKLESCFLLVAPMTKAPSWCYAGAVASLFALGEVEHGAGLKF